MDQVRFFKGCLPQILLGLFLNTLTIYCFSKFQISRLYLTEHISTNFSRLLSLIRASYFICKLQVVYFVKSSSKVLHCSSQIIEKGYSRTLITRFSVSLWRTARLQGTNGTGFKNIQKHFFLGRF